MSTSRISLAALVSGALFGLGLAVSGMTDPQRILGFLDVSGDFNPALLFVLGGAVTTTMLLFRFVLRRPAPVFAERFQISDLRSIDRRLLIGAALFGIGWGLVGICPGPGIVLLGTGQWQAYVFIPAMIIGMLLYQWLEPKLSE